MKSVFNLFFRKSFKYPPLRDVKIERNFSQSRINSSQNNFLLKSIAVIGVSYYLYKENNVLALSLPFVIGKSKEQSNNNQTPRISLKAAIEYSDRKDYDPEKAYQQLKPFTNEPKQTFEFCWRYARVAIAYALLPHIDGSVSKSLFQEAVSYAQKALVINPWSSDAHLWCGIALSHTNSYESYITRIRNSAIIKIHFERAIEFNPMDPFPHYMLGMWHFTVADYNLISKLLTMIFFGGGSMLTSFHEALVKFEDAERIKRNFSIKNHLMLGKTNFRIGNYEAARKWLDHVLKMPATNKEEQEIKDDAMFIIDYLDHIVDN